MADMVKTLSALAAEATAELGAGGTYDGAKVGLYKTLVQPTPDLVLADLDLPTYTTYAISSAVVWGDHETDALDRIIAVGGIKEFTASVDSPVEQVQGAYLVDGAGTTLLALYPFDSPQSIGLVGQVVRVAPYGVFGNATGGAPVIET